MNGSSRRRATPAQLQRLTVALRAASRMARAVGLGQREQLLQLRRQLRRVPGLEAREMAQVRRVLLLEPVGDLGQAGVAGDERRRARGGRLRRDHPERLREDRRDDGRVGEREQVDEVAVLERAGEERSRAGRRLERLAVVAEADDHGAGVDLLQRLEQDVDALVVEELPEVDDRRLVAGEERGEPLGVALVRQPLVRVAGVRRILRAPPRAGRPAPRRAGAGATRRRRRRAAPRGHARRGRPRPPAPPGCGRSRRRPPRPARARPDPTRTAPRCRAASTRARSRAP